ncbi:lipopolysaccharide assembly lipoprotein [Candidatus Symbiobacter mobilis CR]|uniref:LPS-assembly lipoprotein LptE n=1 Tax=Candidatus Symbiobacter mobilis CR TaxID=946483 RepID=U5N9W0_9BURK|nr:lipopolysaccharide assembly lipoprotein [Candidatus Symbiobacter mobilis CR]
MLCALALSLSLAGCGFHLHQGPGFAFDRIAIAPHPGGAVAQELRRELSRSVTVLEPGDVAAQLLVRIDHEQSEKTVVGINAAGQVRELQLRYKVRFAVTTPTGEERIPETELRQQRDFGFHESYALAKEVEEAALVRDMQSSIARQLVRRLAAIQDVR